MRRRKEGEEGTKESKIEKGREKKKRESEKNFVTALYQNYY